MLLPPEALTLATALVGLVTTVTASWLARREWKEKKEYEALLTSRPPGEVNVLPFLTEWVNILSEIESIMDETVIDRFLMFEGRNGTAEVRRVTAFFQLREHGQKSYD